MSKKKKCKNGCKKFYAHQVCYATVVVDKDGNFLYQTECYDSDEPYGPYKCYDCGTEYEEIPEINSCDKNDCIHYIKDKILTPISFLNEACKECVHNKEAENADMEHYFEDKK